MYSTIKHDEVISIVIVGHVDHGKSTVIGRLLVDNGSLPEGKLEQIEESCRQNSKPFEFAFLLDALKNEQSQGITIDSARCFFATKKRRYIVIDAPGHIELLKNMVSGSSRAEAALIVIDASLGVEENTKRHAYYLSMLGINQVAVLINKMDLVGYSQDIFLQVKNEISRFLERIGTFSLGFIPVSGKYGDNIVSHSQNMPWYKGNTLLLQIDAFKPEKPLDNLPLRFPIQDVYKFTENHDTRRIVAGTIETGKIQRNDRIVFYPSKKTTRVQTLEKYMDVDVQCFSAGQAAGITLADQIFVKRGEIICLSDEKPPHVSSEIKVHLFWLGDKMFEKSRSYYLKCNTAKVKMQLKEVVKTIDSSSLHYRDSNSVNKNEVAECILSLERPIAFDTVNECALLSRFVIVDGYEIAGGGKIVEALACEENEHEIHTPISISRLHFDSWKHLPSKKGEVIWFTGYSGAGKTTIAQEVKKHLDRYNIANIILDGDILRLGLCADLKYSKNDRIENLRRIAHVAKLFCDTGFVVLVTTISPYKECRAFAKDLIGKSFSEVYVYSEIKECARRDPKGLYKQAAKGTIKNFTGFDSSYEKPCSPDLVLNTQKDNIEICTLSLLNYLSNKLYGHDM